MMVYFRTDASTRIGTGHVMRCLSLARELVAGGASVAFICRAHQGHMAEYIRNQEGYAVHLLPDNGFSGPTPPGGAAHADWLGADWSIDARQTATVIRSEAESVDWIVLDHYAIDHRWEKALRPVVKGVFVIDDLADRAHDCDILVDQNLYPRLESRYDTLIGSECRKLLGPGYALLRREFPETRKRLRPRDGKVRRALVFFGGADPTNETGKALDAWEILGTKDLALDVVVGGANPHRESIQERCGRHPGLKYHFQARNMAELMADADLAIGAGGTATWERCCLSLPTLCITIAENQRLLAETAHSAGLIAYLGHYDSVSSSDLAGALAECLRSPGRLSEMSRKAGEMADGLGAPRVAAFLLGGSGTLGSASAAGTPGISGTGSRLSLRSATREDVLTYHGWANDPVVRASAFNKDPIPLENHEKWFLAKLEDPHASLYVLESGGKPAGQIRFDLTDDCAEIDFSVDASYRGRGLGVELLKRGALALQAKSKGPLNLIGHVKQANSGSVKAFMSAGFERVSSEMKGGEPCLMFRKALRGRS